MGDGRFNAISAKRAGHAQYMDGFQDAGLAAPIGAKKDVNLAQTLKAAMAQVPDLLNMELLQSHKLALALLKCWLSTTRTYWG
jgi:hypothetical protein